MSKDIIVLDQNRNLADLYQTDNGIEDILSQLENQARSMVFDLTTDTGKKECISYAYNIAKSKTALVKAGKSQTEDARAFIKTVNSQTKEVEERLDALRDEVRRPITELENKEKERKAILDKALSDMSDFVPAIGIQLTLEEIEQRLNGLNKIHEQTDWQEYKMKAQADFERHTAALNSLKTAANAIAELKAKKEAEEKAERERQEKERIAAAEKAAKEKAEREAAEKIAKAEAEKKKAEEEAKAAQLKIEENAKKEQQRLEKIKEDKSKADNMIAELDLIDFSKADTLEEAEKNFVLATEYRSKAMDLDTSVYKEACVVFKDYHEQSRKVLDTLTQKRKEELQISYKKIADETIENINKLMNFDYDSVTVSELKTISIKIENSVKEFFNDHGKPEYSIGITGLQMKLDDCKKQLEKLISSKKDEAAKQANEDHLTAKKRETAQSLRNIDKTITADQLKTIVEALFNNEVKNVRIVL